MFIVYTLFHQKSFLQKTASMHNRNDLHRTMFRIVATDYSVITQYHFSVPKIWELRQMSPDSGNVCNLSAILKIFCTVYYAYKWESDAM
jgi:hypothetical protein